ncbi:MAG: serine/threonine-protein kinase [Vicinamibacterales bacterium]
MTPSQWQRVRAIFEALVDLDSTEARQRLDADAGDDDAVRAEVLSLLDHHSRAGTFLAEAVPLESPGLTGGLEPGDTVGPYVIVRAIGRGGMGDVSLATDTRLQRQVCLKAVRSDLAGDPRFRHRLTREARLAGSLNHPGICAVYALEEIEGQLYLVSEFVEGRTLRDEIAEQRLPTAAEVVTTCREVAEALAAAHGKGIAHRDLKPENVMRDSGGRIRILDFGLARPDGELGPSGAGMTEPGVLIGTPAYMAPEQVNGGPVDRRTDLFALGVLIYEYATGVHPFASSTPLATAARILEHVAEPLERRRPDLPPGLAVVVGRCLRKEPVERFESVDALLAALGSPQPGAVAVPQRRWWRRHQLALGGLYFVACVAAWTVRGWEPSLAGRWAFVLTSVLAAVCGVVRGHLLFTDRFHPDRLIAEARRTSRVLQGFDLGIALTVLGAASLVVDVHPVPGVLIMGLAAGIGAAAIDPRG